jgi:hypothetical protein
MGSFLGFHPEVVWKSPWRLDLERWQTEEAMKPRRIVKADQIQARQEKAVKAPSKPRGPRKPRVPKTDRRIGVRKRRYRLVERSKFCAVCEIPLNVNNTHGLCREHWQNQQRELSLGARPTCKFDGCQKKLYRDNAIGLCREHGDPVRRKAWEEANKEKSIERKKAWYKANPDRRRKARKDMVQSSLHHAE